jgi:hypothetical protein
LDHGWREAIGKKRQPWPLVRGSPLAAPVLLLAASLAAARAEDRATWFRGLKQPGTDNYRCDVSDCRRTEAEWRHDQWWAIVQGVWMPIPRDKELTVKSIDGNAYVCSGWARVIFCFIPPNFVS